MCRLVLSVPWRARGARSAVTPAGAHPAKVWRAPCTHAGTCRRTSGAPATRRGPWPAEPQGSARPGPRRWWSIGTCRSGHSGRWERLVWVGGDGGLPPTSRPGSWRGRTVCPRLRIWRVWAGEESLEIEFWVARIVVRKTQIFLVLIVWSIYFSFPFCFFPTFWLSQRKITFENHTWSVFESLVELNNRLVLVKESTYLWSFLFRSKKKKENLNAHKLSRRFRLIFDKKVLSCAC